MGMSLQSSAAATTSQRQLARLSPSMWMGLSLLPLPIADLKAEIKKEVESNPAIELAPQRGPIHSAGSAADYLENVAADSSERLDEHLLAELRMSGVEGRDLELCRAIVSELDSDGRFTGSLPDMMMVTGASEAELEAARQRVMTIDPRGCGARDLAECFLAQIGSVPAAKRDRFRREVPSLRTTPKLSPDIIAILKKLDPFPGRQYDHRKVDYVTPDVVVDEDGDVYVDQRDIPELQVSPKYVAMAKDRSLDEETRQYAAERVKRAREFQEAVIKRLETVEKVAELAVGGQTEFLKEGVSGIRKQTMSDVAKRAKCSVATVSRAAARKYVKTPRGTLPLRKFFALVDQAPIERLRALLASFPEGQRPSDQRLSDLLAKEGIHMARRTVAKYREKFERTK